MMKSIFPRQRKAAGDGVVDGLSLFLPRGRMLYPPPHIVISASLAPSRGAGGGF
jgi:hypothetical protein